MYLVRQVKKDIYEVAKFEDSNFPTDVYTVKSTKCNCPASYRSKKCKHNLLVDEFKKVKKGIFAFELTSSNEVRLREMPELV